jgi:succinyl-diaminopimelate desuccinylase
LRSDMLAFAKRLIRIRTENPPGSNYGVCTEVIAGELEQLGIRPVIVKVRCGAGSYSRYCLLASWGKGRRVLYFHGHYDVVPASSRQSFQPKVHEGRLFGRGASDMKGGLAAMVYAVRILQLLHVELRGQVRLVFVPDEETGGACGTGYLFDHGYMRPEMGIGMLMPEPTGGAVWNACRGAYSLMVNVKGKPVHVVLQNKGINAFEQMVELSEAMIRLKYSVEKKKTGYCCAAGESRNSIMMLGGICKCGTNFNIVPGDCTFSIERRINPEENLAEEKKRLQNVLDRFRKRGMNISTTVLQEGESAGISSDHYLARVLVKSIRELRGQSPRFYMCPGLLETRYYLKHGIPAYAYGPGLLSRAHHPQEYLPLPRMFDCAEIYAMAAVRMLGEDEACSK